MAKRGARDVVFVGADGALGASLVPALGARGVSLRAPDMTDDAPLPELAAADVVVNAAGPRVHPGLGWNDYLREHVATATRVARSMRRDAYLVHVSSAAVYGAARPFVDARTPELPASFPVPAYAWAKLAGEYAVRAVAAERGIALTVLRPSIIYGPGSGGVFVTLRGLAARGVRFAIRPARLRQHLLHLDLFQRVLEALVARGQDRDRARDAEPEILVVADPFVLSTAEVNEAIAGGAASPSRLPAIPVPVPIAAAAVRAWRRAIDLQSPGMVAVAAMLALDNEYDWRDAFERLGLSPDEFGRHRFDAFMAASTGGA